MSVVHSRQSLLFSNRSVLVVQCSQHRFYGNSLYFIANCQHNGHQIRYSLLQCLQRPFCVLQLHQIPVLVYLVISFCFSNRLFFCLKINPVLVEPLFNFIVKINMQCIAAICVFPYPKIDYWFNGSFQLLSQSFF